VKYYFNIELTDKCNAACPFCDRTLWPKNLEQAELTISDISKFFNGIKVSSVLFSGLYGDPVFCKDLIPIVEYFHFNKTSIEIGTNGSKKGI
jgi:MoaA/NifB/PqqE/SkfB family radical SAM enzyme